VLVALLALHACMRPSERKRRFRMVKQRRFPARDSVAHLALLRYPSGSMVGIVRFGVVVQVATHASRAGQLEIAIFVTLIALQIGVSPGQREPDRIMIKSGSEPRVDAVALF